MSYFGLNIAGSAIATFQQAANVTSDDIANVNTPGASRQVVNIGQLPPVTGSPGYATWQGPGTKGDGINVSDIARIHQDSYDEIFRGASSSQNFFSVQDDALAALQSSFGEPANGINQSFSNLQTAISQLAANPRGTSERQGVLAKTQAFVNKLNAVATSLANAKSSAIADATKTVDKINGIIDKIASLNGQIRASRAVGDNPNTYLDQRDQLVDQLSTLLNTQSAIQSNGSTLVTVGGRALVNDTTAYHLAAPVIGADASGNPTLEVAFVKDPTPANPTYPVPIAGGQLQGYLDLYNTKLAPYAAQLDQYANATAFEVDQVTQATYDQNGNPGQALLQPIVTTPGLPAAQVISASNIKVGITDPAQVGAALASTAAGTLVVAANAGNNTVDTSQNVVGLQALAHPATGTTGVLTVTVDGVAQTFAYDTTAGTGTDASIDKFVTHFNQSQLGVSASWDQVGQKIVFTRDPANVSFAHRAQVAANGTTVTPTFTIADNQPSSSGALGAPTGSILELLGANAINGVQQNGTNAYGSADNGGVNAILKIFARNVGVPSLQASSATAVAAGATVTIAPPGPNPRIFANVGVGAVLTLGAGTPAQENVVVTAVNKTTGTITFTARNAHAAGFSIQSAAQATLTSAYGALVGKLGLDAQTASVGSDQQTKLSANINKVRQSISGINVDEETQNLIKFQNAYVAAAKTLNVMSQLLQTAVDLIR